MIFDENYRQRLKEYCLNRVEEEGGIRKWTRKLKINKDTIDPWLKGVLTEPIRLNTLHALAWDRGETPEETRDWLEGTSLLDRVEQASPGMVEAIHELCHELINKKGSLPLVRSGTHSCTLSLDKEKQMEEGFMPDFELIEIGARRHLKLKAILIASLRIKKIPLDNLEVIALAIGYDKSQRKRFNAGIEMLETFLMTDSYTLDYLGDYHLGYLANFCHKLIRYSTSPSFHAICADTLGYEGNTERLLADITCKGAVIS